MSPALVRRFAHDLAVLAGAPGEDEHFALAVSGGPDSLALLLLARAALPGRVHAATVDHGLRPEAADEAVGVARLCAELGVPHATLKVSVPTGGDGLQANARAARYRAMGEWAWEHAMRFVLTAHHLDDQAETFLMRLLRGSGVAGLASVRPRTPIPGGGGELLRPLLSWRRAELVQLVQAAGLSFTNDPSNTDPARDRARLRAHLAATPWLDPVPVARSASHLAAAEDALAWTADLLWDERARRDPEGWTLDLDGLPDELKRRLVARCLQELDAGARPRGRELTHLLAILHQGGTATLAGILASGGILCRFRRARPRL